MSPTPPGRLEMVGKELWFHGYRTQVMGKVTDTRMPPLGWLLQTAANQGLQISCGKKALRSEVIEEITQALSRVPLTSAVGAPSAEAEAPTHAALPHSVANPPEPPSTPSGQPSSEGACTSHDIHLGPRSDSPPANNTPHSPSQTPAASLSSVGTEKTLSATGFPSEQPADNPVPPPAEGTPNGQSRPTMLSCAATAAFPATSTPESIPSHQHTPSINPSAARNVGKSPSDGAQDAITDQNPTGGGDSSFAWDDHHDADFSVASKTSPLGGSHIPPGSASSNGPSAEAQSHAPSQSEHSPPNKCSPVAPGVPPPFSVAISTQICPPAPDTASENTRTTPSVGKRAHPTEDSRSTSSHVIPPDGVVEFVPRDTTVTEIRRVSPSQQRRKLLHCQSQEAASLMLQPGRQLQEVGYNLLADHARIERLISIKRVYDHTSFDDVWDPDLSSDPMYKLRGTIGNGPLDSQRFSEGSPPPFQIGSISLCHDELYIDRVFFLLSSSRLPERRLEVWTKLVVLHLPMVDDVKDFRCSCLRDALLYPRELRRWEVDVIEKYLGLPRQDRLVGMLDDSLLLKVYHIAELTPVMVLQNLDPMSLSSRFATKYLRTGYSGKLSSNLIFPQCPLFILTHQRWSGSSEAGQHKLFTVELLLPQGKDTTNPLISIWDKGFPTNLDGHYLPFYEANPYQSFPSMRDLNLDSKYFVPIAPLINHLAVDTSQYRQTTIPDCDLPHNMWVERAFLESFLQHSYQNDFCTLHWRVLCENTYRCVVNHFDSTREGISIHAHHVFNDPTQFSTVMARMRILSCLFNVRVVLVRMQGTRPGHVLLEEPHHREGVTCHPPLRTVIIGYEEGHPPNSYHKFYSAKCFPGPRHYPDHAALQSPTIFEKATAFNSIVPLDGERVPFVVRGDVDSVVAGCSCPIAFAKTFVHVDATAPSHGTPTMTRAVITRHPHPNQKQGIAEQRQRIVLYHDGSNSGAYKLDRKADPDFIYEILCPMECFPTLHIGKLYTPEKNTKFTLTITLVDTESYPSHLELKPPKKKPRKRTFTKEDLASWEEILSMTTLKWRSLNSDTPEQGLSAIYAQPPSLQADHKDIELVGKDLELFFTTLHDLCHQLHTGSLPSKRPQTQRLAGLLLHKSIYKAFAAGIKHQVELGKFKSGGSRSHDCHWDGEALFLNQSQNFLEQAKRDVLVSIIPNPQECSIIGIDIGHTTFVEGGQLDLFVLNEKAHLLAGNNLDHNASMARNEALKVQQPLLPIVEFLYEPHKGNLSFLRGVAVQVKSKGYAVGALASVVRSGAPGSFVGAVRFLTGYHLPEQHFPLEELFIDNPSVDRWRKATLLFLEHPRRYQTVWTCLHDETVFINSEPSPHNAVPAVASRFCVLPLALGLDGQDQYQWQEPWPDPPAPTPDDPEASPKIPSSQPCSPTPTDPATPQQQASPPPLGESPTSSPTKDSSPTSPRASTPPLHQHTPHADACPGNTHAQFTITPTDQRGVELTDNRAHLGYFTLRNERHNHSVRLRYADIPHGGGSWFQAINLYLQLHKDDAYDDGRRLKLALIDFLKKKSHTEYAAVSRTGGGSDPENQTFGFQSQEEFNSYLDSFVPHKTYPDQLLRQATAEFLQSTIVIFQDIGQGVPGSARRTVLVCPSESSQDSTPDSDAIPIHCNGAPSLYGAHYSALVEPHLPPKKLHSDGILPEFTILAVNEYGENILHDQNHAGFFELNNDRHDYSIDLIFFPVEGDGNCWFHAISLHVAEYRNGEAQKLRLDVVEHLKKKQYTEYAPFYLSPASQGGDDPDVPNGGIGSQSEFNSYLDKFKSPEKYADQLLCQATAEFLGRTIVIFNDICHNRPRSFRKTTTLGPSDVPKESLPGVIPVHYNGDCSSNGGHYSGLVRNKKTPVYRIRGRGAPPPPFPVGDSVAGDPNLFRSTSPHSNPRSPDGSSVHATHGNHPLFDALVDPKAEAADEDYVCSEDEDNVGSEGEDGTFSRRSLRNRRPRVPTENRWRQRTFTKYPFLCNRRTCGYASGANFDFNLTGNTPLPGGGVRPIGITCLFPGPTGTTIYHPVVKFAQPTVNSHWHDIDYLPAKLYRLFQLHHISSEEDLLALCRDFCCSISNINGALSSYWVALAQPQCVRIESHWLFSPTEPLSPYYRPLAASSIAKPCVQGQLVEYARSKIESHLSPLSILRTKLQSHLNSIDELQANSTSKAKLVKQLRGELFGVKEDVLATLLAHCDACSTLLKKQPSYVPPKKSISHPIWRTDDNYDLVVDEDFVLPQGNEPNPWGLSYLISGQSFPLNPVSVPVDETEQSDDSITEPGPPSFDHLLTIPPREVPKDATAKSKSSGKGGSTYSAGVPLARLSMLCKKFIRANSLPMLSTLEESLANCILSLKVIPDQGNSLSELLTDIFSLSLELYFQELHQKLAKALGENEDPRQFRELPDLSDLDLLMWDKETVVISRGNICARKEVLDLFGSGHANHRDPYFQNITDLSQISRFMFGVKDFSNVKDACSPSQWKGRHHSNPSVIVLHTALRLLEATRRLLERNSATPNRHHTLGREALLHHFVAAFLNQPFHYLAYLPNSKYHLSKHLIISCKSVLPQDFQGTPSQLSHFMKQYIEGSSSATSSHGHRVEYNGHNLSLPLDESVKGTGPSKDIFREIAGCCTKLTLASGPPRYPNKTEKIPTVFTILLVRYLTSIQVEGKLPPGSFWKNPMVPGVNLCLHELYSGYPNSSNMKDQLKNWPDRMAKLNPFFVGMPEISSRKDIEVSNGFLRHPDTFWSAMHSGLTPNVAMAWRFARLYYNSLPDHPQSPKEKQAWSRDCARLAIGHIFPQIAASPSPPLGPSTDPVANKQSSSHTKKRKAAISLQCRSSSPSASVVSSRKKTKTKSRTQTHT